MPKRFKEVEYYDGGHLIKKLEDGFFTIKDGNVPHDVEALVVLRDLLNEVIADEQPELVAKPMDVATVEAEASPEIIPWKPPLLA